MHWPLKKPYLAPLLSLIIAVCVLWIVAVQLSDAYNAEIKRSNLEIEAFSLSVQQELLAKFHEITLAHNLAAAEIESNITLNPNDINKNSALLMRYLKQLSTTDTIGMIDASGKLIALQNKDPNFNLTNKQKIIELAIKTDSKKTIASFQTDNKENKLIIIHTLKDKNKNEVKFFSTIPQKLIKEVIDQFDKNKNTSISIMDINLNILSKNLNYFTPSVNPEQLKIVINSKKQFDTINSYQNSVSIQTSIRRIQGSPFFIVISSKNSKYLSTWKRGALVYILGSFLMLSFSLMMAYYFWRTQRLNQHLIQKENKLIASETKFRQMIEAMPIGLILARMPDFLIMYINQPAAHILDMPQATALSKRAFDFYNDIDDFKQQINQVTALETPKNIECILRKNNNQEFWGSISISMVQVGEIQTLLISLMDISERKKLEAELKYQATTDILSGLINRAHFIQLASNEIQRIQRHERSASLLMLDIDHFKRVNDNYGHDAGDLVIQAIAAICKNILRDIDIVGRLGGEEFAALLPETSSAAALLIAERLRSAIELSNIRLKYGQIINITSSIGVTEVSIKDQTIDIPLKRADLAMYASKNNGRNQVQYYKNINQ